MDTTREGEVQSILSEFTGLDNIVSHLRKIDPNEVESVSPETLKGYVAFGALMCYNINGGNAQSASELDAAWNVLGRTLGIEAEKPASAGASG